MLSPDKRFEIRPAASRAAMRDFHSVPYRVYLDDPNWIPPLLLERRAHFSTSMNPYFQHATARYWVAYRNGEAVGRISAQINRLHLERYHDAAGHFGFIEARDDPAVFAALLGAAEDWLRVGGMTHALGPISFSMWDQCGLLVEGFDSPPYFMMGHAKPYFDAHIKAAGYRGVQDLLAFVYDRYTPLPPVADRIVQRALKSEDVVVRPILKDRKHFDGEIASLMEIINDAWSDNWGFVPITADEMHEIAMMVRLVLRPGDVAIAEFKGEPAAFTMVIPDFNEAIRDLGGRLFPLGWAKALWRLKVSGLRRTRMPFMGVKKKFQTSPIGAALALGVIASARKFNVERGGEYGELSWVLDQNEQVKRIISLVGAREHKRYRIYEKRVAEPVV
jgi:hypothetical protein